ncbi:MAG: TatD family hydrolase [Spirochaetales bacterium]|nr:TatD family hydrolase [Spirochaetales bacterium]
MTTYTDAHFHANDFALVDPGFAAEYRSMGVLGLASAHDAAGLAATRRLLAEAGSCFVSFGIHPQLAVMDEADELASLAAAGAIDAVGECGFDFYGDAPDLVRSPENERGQRAVFDYQLELALRYGLPVVLHLRRANDLLFEYARRLSQLRAVILHSWGGPANEALDFLSRCPNALFSFGNATVNGNKKAAASVAALPATALLSETDAPYQPPRASAAQGAAGQHRPLARAYSSFADLPAIVATMAGIREQPSGELGESIHGNFMAVFDHGL